MEGLVGETEITAGICVIKHKIRIHFFGHRAL
jgi:hypothetical protein